MLTGLIYNWTSQSRGHQGEDLGCLTDGGAIYLVRTSPITERSQQSMKVIGLEIDGHIKIQAALLKRDQDDVRELSSYISVSDHK